jgi:hypothetical protein
VGRGGRGRGADHLAVTWLSVALGMVTKSVEAASNLPMPLVFLPFLWAKKLDNRDPAP